MSGKNQIFNSNDQPAHACKVTKIEFGKIKSGLNIRDYRVWIEIPIFAECMVVSDLCVLSA